MMLNELMLAQQIEAIQRLQLAWTEFEAEPRISSEPEATHPGLRHAIAATLVRLGVMLDRSAAEALPAPARPSGNKEAHHAL